MGEAHDRKVLEELVKLHGFIRMSLQKTTDELIVYKLYKQLNTLEKEIDGKT